MRSRLVALLLLIPLPAAALTLDDCTRWLQQLRGEASKVEVSGAQGRNDRQELLDDLDEARAQDDATKTADALRNVDEFRQHAARLTAEGKVSPVAGKRLDTLSDTYRHCVEQVRKTR